MLVSSYRLIFRKRMSCESPHILSVRRFDTSRHVESKPEDFEHTFVNLNFRMMTIFNVFERRFSRCRNRPDVGKEGVKFSRRLVELRRAFPEEWSEGASPRDQKREKCLRPPEQSTFATFASISDFRFIWLC